MPARAQPPRWFFDENSIGIAQALHHVRGDVTWPGGPDSPVSAGTPDQDWLPVVGQHGLVVLTRDKKIRSRPLERKALLDHGVRACFQTAGGQLTLFEQLRLWLRRWDDVEALVEHEPGPWLAGVNRAGAKIFDRSVVRPLLRGRANNRRRRAVCSRTAPSIPPARQLRRH